MNGSESGISAWIVFLCIGLPIVATLVHNAIDKVRDKKKVPLAKIDEKTRNELLTAENIIKLELCTTPSAFDRFFDDIGMQIEDVISFLLGYMRVVDVLPLSKKSFEKMPTGEQYELLRTIYISGDWRQIADKRY